MEKPFLSVNKGSHEGPGANHINTFSGGFQKIQMQTRIKTSPVSFFSFWPCCSRFSLVAASGACFLLRRAGLSLQRLLLLWSTDSRAQVQWLWHVGFTVPRHVGSYPTRNQTRVSCIGRWILLFYFVLTLYFTF